MDLQALTQESTILLRQDFSSKSEVIQALCRRLEQAGTITSADAFYEDVMERERLGSTGIENGLAIPHGKSEAVRKASFAAATLQTPLDGWESVDPDNRVRLVFLLAIPKAEEGSTHLAVLAELSKRLIDDDYRQRLLDAPTPAAFLERLQKQGDSPPSETPDGDSPLVLAVTACPAGIAHTYMAAEALEQAGRDLGVRVRVEKQGANGIEDAITQEELNVARGVIFANDVQIKDEERFAGLPVVKTGVAGPLRQAAPLIERALRGEGTVQRKSSDGATTPPPHGENPSVGQEIKQAVLTGISYIVPLIIAGGMLLAVSLFIAQAFDLKAAYETKGAFLNLMRELGGGMLSTLMIPVLAAYISYSLADKPGLAPGFAAGLAASLIETGFVGGLAGGLVAGYIVRWMKRHIRTSGVFSGFVTFWVYPVLGSVVVACLMFLVIGQPIALLNGILVDGLKNLSGTNAILLGAVIGIMVSFDLGGPVNKAAYAFCIGVMADGNLVPYATFASVKMVSAFSVTLATVLFKKYFEEYEREVGKSTWVLGLAGITEGAIPFMLRDPIRVILAFITGSAVTGAIVAYFGIGLPVPGAGIFSLFFLKGDGILLNMAVWFGAAVLGTLISTVLLVLLKIQRNRKPAREAAQS